MTGFAAIVADRGEETVIHWSLDYDLLSDENGLYFEYGVSGQEHIHIDNFEEI